jgi:hypothetical protein
MTASAGEAACLLNWRYSEWLVNKTPTLHWGQATMLCTLAGLYRSL